MCYGLPAKSLDQAKQRLTPEQWSRFEREFDDFCVIHGMPRNPGWSIFLWAKWAFFQGRQWSIHHSDCATHNEPAYPNGPCDCGVDQRVADAKYTRLAIAMMSDEQAQMSLERWKEGK